MASNVINAAANFAERMLGHVETATPTQPRTTDESMHVITWHGKHDVRYSEVERPTITDPRDIVLKVTATTVCGSDCHYYKGNIPNMKEGDQTGHECMGIVEKVGDDVETLQVGDRIVVSFNISCGECSYCQREEYTSCDVTNPSKLMEKMYGHRTAGLFGYSGLAGGHIPGCQTEYLRVPFADVNCLKVPETVSDEKALYLSDVLCTSRHACDQANLKEGDIVGIWGLGAIGLLACRWAQILGASRIVAIDNVLERLAIARELGVEVINYDNVSDGIVEEVQRLVPGGFDCAIDATGFRFAKSIKHKVELIVGLETDTSDIVEEIFKCVRKNGSVSLIADYLGYTNHFPLGTMVMKHLNVQGGQSPTQKYWKYVLSKLEDGTMDPAFIITHRGPLSAVPTMYKLMANQEDGIVKPFIRPDYLWNASPDTTTVTETPAK